MMNADNVSGKEKVHESATTCDDSQSSLNETVILPMNEITVLPQGEEAFFQRYQLRGVLGEGGMAIIYEAYEKMFDRATAVKVMRPETLRDGELRQRFLFEATLLGQMDHPGIIPVYDKGELTDLGPFYVMKKVQGTTLRTILNGANQTDINQPHEMAQLLRIFEKVCLTVAYAHSKGIVHRDIKPQNIMVDDYGVVLVLDWGMAKNIHISSQLQGLTATQQGVIKGTPAYMSPEQATGEEVDFRTDVFSLGIILYEMLTGRLPFLGKSHSEVLTEIVEHEPPHPRHINQRAGRVLSAICMKALNKDPAMRYPTAKELAEDIRLCRDFLPTSACKPSLWGNIGNWIGRHPVKATALGTAAVLIVVFGIIGYHRTLMERVAMEERQRMAELAESNATMKRTKLVKERNQHIDAMLQKVKELDEQILNAEKALSEATDPDEQEQHKAQLEEYRSTRNIYYDDIQRNAMVVISILMAGSEGGPEKLDPAVMERFRKIMLGHIESLIKTHDYYPADNYVWWYLVHSSYINWSGEEMATLLRFKNDIESKMKEGKGPNFQLPDWEKYAPQKLTSESVPEFMR